MSKYAASLNSSELSDLIRRAFAIVLPENDKVKCKLLQRDVMAYEYLANEESTI